MSLPWLGPPWLSETGASSYTLCREDLHLWVCHVRCPERHSTCWHLKNTLYGQCLDSFALTDFQVHQCLVALGLCVLSLQRCGFSSSQLSTMSSEAINYHACLHLMLTVLRCKVASASCMNASRELVLLPCYLFICCSLQVVIPDAMFLTVVGVLCSRHNASVWWIQMGLFISHAVATSCKAITVLICRRLPEVPYVMAISPSAEQPNTVTLLQCFGC